MKRMLWSAGVLAVAMATGLAGVDADAKRLGGGGSSGMQRSVPTRPAQQNTPPQQAPAQQPGPTAAAAPAAAGATAAAAAGRRSWLGPIAGIAAGLGIAALLSHLGLGAAFAEFLTLALLVIVAIVAVRFLMRRFGRQGASQRGLGYAGAGAGTGTAGAGPATPWRAEPPLQQRSAAADWGRPAGATAPGQGLAPIEATGAGVNLPADFDREGFERIAKLIFIRMQAANDAGNLDDLRQFTTPEMFAAARLDLHNRGGGAQRTDVVQLQAEVLDLARDNGQDIVSVRYHGLIREDDAGAAPQPFDEVWHLVRPSGASGGGWAVAGIQQAGATTH
ncbi:Tim44 domain-containing protein [Aquabacterium sp. J223]|uniref:Tim44 domain-containing protein n=1 Tax=Aquabacterium sp. J223 TaxID=2898431 RepID=UPI0021AD8EC7|nr:Tim44-like domain-containing protein [Aquabacterium sp. J223]UUX96192.1 39S ribosomal protein L45 [Aquabacterium sp. J223]